MRRLALQWLWWAFVWDLMRYCARNPFRFFVLIPLLLVSLAVVIFCSPRIWRANIYWNIGECWDTIQSGEVKAPPLWLACRLFPRNYDLLGDRSCD